MKNSANETMAIGVMVSANSTNLDDALTLASRNVELWYIVDLIPLVTSVLSVSVHAWLPVTRVIYYEGYNEHIANSPRTSQWVPFSLSWYPLMQSHSFVV